MEQRRNRRFDLALPLAIVRQGDDAVLQAGETKNISSRGVLFTAERKIDFGGPIEYVVTLSGDTEAAVNIRCIGFVLRQDGLEVAATMERHEFFRLPPADPTSEPIAGEPESGATPRERTPA